MVQKEKPILRIEELKTYFFTEHGVVRAVDGVDLTVFPNEIVGLVGESGCGKSVTSLSIMGLLASTGRIVGGKIFFGEDNLLDLNKKQLQNIRGNKISMIFQQPQSSLNPVLPVGSQIAEILRIHESMSSKSAWSRAEKLMELVGLPSVKQKSHSFPHELSGGQAQRVMIAMALALKPKLLIADEPTTALDVTIQAQILDLIREKNQLLGTAVILITHDLGIVAEMANYVAVMYAGRIVEKANVNDLFNDPLHPYTQGLLKSLPVLGEKKTRLDVIPGNVPNLMNLNPGCKFADRCSLRSKYKINLCRERDPILSDVVPGHKVACWLYDNDINQSLSRLQTKDHVERFEI